MTYCGQHHLRFLKNLVDYNFGKEFAVDRPSVELGDPVSNDE